MKDAYYFPHDSNSKDDPKCVMLIEQLGMEGYGIFWVLIETLREQPKYKYPLALIPALARRYCTTTEKARTVVMQYGLFQIEDDEFFYSKSLNQRMEIYDRKREQSRMAGKSSAQKRLGCAEIERPFNERSTTVQPPFNDRSTSKVKESKVKESKREESKVDTIAENPQTPYPKIIELYSSICVSYPKLTTLSDSRKKAIKARLNTYSIDDFEKLFTMAEESDFLKGKNKNNWSATFDWMIKDSSMAKILDGNFSNKTGQANKSSNPYADMVKEGKYD